MRRQWLGVPRILTPAALHGRSTKLPLPMTSPIKEFKATKSKLNLMLHDLTDPVISNVAPEVKSGRKLQGAAAVEDAISSHQLKDIVGAKQVGQ